MSKETRNTRMQRKTGKKARRSTDFAPAPRRAAGTKVPNVVSTPKSPRKARHNAHQSEMTQNQHNSSQNGSHNKGRSRRAKGREGGAGWIWGAHACQAVLANPKRTIHTIMMTDTAVSRFPLPDNAPPPKIVLPGMLDRQLDGAVHQGIAIKCAPLEWPDIASIAAEAGDEGLILVLDQITDPHNVGAMLRLCSAFGASALVMQDRKAPPLSGATAKVAVGCVESVPVCLVTNIANTLQTLKQENWTVTGLAGETDISLHKALKGGGRQVIVMGAEGPGLRQRVKDTCDQLARIPMMSQAAPGQAALGQAESLNVATAAGIALYEARRKD